VALSPSVRRCDVINSLLEMFLGKDKQASVEGGPMHSLRVASQIIYAHKVTVTHGRLNSARRAQRNPLLLGTEKPCIIFFCMKDMPM